ncbi:MAG: putative selenium-dependent hydroxylase accessory protein YqeC, partial [Oscillospiraceae bacterium]|nr:putative selenium-dependent hydroxylase accessory protein YqeC [Oscillospiraceae bacterium]
PPQEIPYLLEPVESEISAALEKDGVICVGKPHETGKLTACSIPVSRLAELCDYLLVEADGSAGLPLKGHGENEPQIPPESNQTVLVLGVWGVGQTIAAAAHRPAIYAALAEAGMEDTVTAEIAAKVISAENFHTRVFINGVEDEEKEKAAHAIAARLDCPVVMGALKEGKCQCLF